MSGRYNKNMGQIKIDKSAVIAYDKKDPRYHLTIEDSDEYTKNIYPLHFKKRCHDSKEFEKMVKYDWPLISRCWGEGYENCAVLQKYGKTCKAGDKPIIETGHCACSRCAMSLYDTIEDTIGYAKVDLRSNNDETNANQNIIDDQDQDQDKLDDLDSDFTLYKPNLYKPNLNKSNSNSSKPTLDLDRTDFEEQNRNTLYDRT